MHGPPHSRSVGKKRGRNVPARLQCGYSHARPFTDYQALLAFPRPVRRMMYPLRPFARGPAGPSRAWRIVRRSPWRFGGMAVRTLSFQTVPKLPCQQAFNGGAIGEPYPLPLKKLCVSVLKWNPIAQLVRTIFATKGNYNSICF